MSSAHPGLRLSRGGAGRSSRLPWRRCPRCLGKQKYYANASPKLYCRNLGHSVNALSLRVAWSIMAWDSNAMAIAKGMAQIIRDNVEPERLVEEPEMLKKKDIGYRGYEI